MEKKYRLEPFNLERAKAGEPVCTQNGFEARIICWDVKGKWPIIALVTGGDNVEHPNKFSNQGYYCGQSMDAYNLMMKVEVKESVVYAEVAGEITPFEKLKAEGFIDLKSLVYLIIKTYDGKFLKIWKKNLPKQEWEEAQVAASSIGEGWRCPTRHECIDIYDARFIGLDKAMEDIKGEFLKEIYWTSEADSNPQYSANYAVCFNGGTGSLYTSNKCFQFSVRPVCTVTNSETEKE